MRVRTPHRGTAIDFLDPMYGSILRHLVAIDAVGKVVARSFEPTQREAARGWIEERVGPPVHATRPQPSDLEAGPANDHAEQRRGPDDCQPEEAI